MTKRKRKIVIVLSRDGSKHTLETDAKTLGELKAATAAAGINTDGLIWYEGVNRVFMKDDDTILPAGGVYKGRYTTSLLFQLGRENKKSEFGATIIRRGTNDVAFDDQSAQYDVYLDEGDMFGGWKNSGNASTERTTPQTRQPQPDTRKFKWSKTEKDGVGEIYDFWKEYGDDPDYTNIFGEPNPEITKQDFLKMVEAADFSAMYNTSHIRQRVGYTIYVIARRIMGKEWEKEVAEKLGTDMRTLAKGTNFPEYDKMKDKFPLNYKRIR